MANRFVRAYLALGRFRGNVTARSGPFDSGSLALALAQGDRRGLPEAFMAREEWDMAAQDS